MQATRPRNHKLTYIRSRCPIAQFQAMNFTKTEFPIITIILPNYFSHGSVALVLLALVGCSKPARFYSKRWQSCSVPTGPQLSCSLARKSAWNQTPLLWHLNNTQLTHGIPSGDILRISRHSQRIGVSNLKIFTVCSCEIWVKVGQKHYSRYTGSTPSMAYPTSGCC